MLYGLTEFLPESMMSFYDILEFALRIVISGVLGVVIGLERSHRLKEAGIRTHSIIAIASALLMILSKYAFLDVVDLGMVGGKGVDPSRIASQVVSGISFLGAGVIFKHGKATIKGLTTAAGMWATAAVGMAIGAGLYAVGCFVTLVMVLIQIILHRYPVGRDAHSIREITVVMRDEPELRAAFEELVKKHHGTIEASDIRKNEGILEFFVSIRSEKPIEYEEAMAFMEANEGVLRISV